VNFKHNASLASLGIRVLAGLFFGLLAGVLIRHQGLGMIFLAALFGGTAFLSIGLGRSRLLVAIAVWLGQYVLFYWQFVRPASASVEIAAPLFITHAFFVFLPAMTIVLGAYIGLLGERMYRTPDKPFQA
jgi:hypothetical protein